MNENFILRRSGRLYNPPAWNKNRLSLINRLHYIISGTAYYKKKYMLQKGYIYIFPSNPNFQLTQDSEDPVDHIYFDFISNEKLNIKDFIEIEPSTVLGLTEILKSAEKTFTLGKKQEKIGTCYFDLITKLLCDYIPFHHYHSKITQDAINVIHQSELKDLTVIEVAKKVNSNEDHLIRCFHKDTGFTPHRYISILKADTATSMISHGSSIKETAEVLGFSSVSSFSTFYKRIRRMLPSEIEQS